jgi:hypothetical protein
MFICDDKQSTTARLLAVKHHTMAATFFSGEVCIGTLL